jgi:hypothetical protein
MKIKVDVDVIKPLIDDLIEKGLTEKGLPKCLGSMVPPIIRRVTEFEDTDLLSPREAIPVDERTDVDLLELLKGDRDKYGNKYVLTQKGLEKIKAYKEERVKVYVEQLVSCVNCKHEAICYKLTVNYMRLIQLEEGVR